MASPSIADHVAEHLALDLAEADERLVRLHADLEVYRLLAQSAIHQLHDLARQHDRLRESYARLIDEYRTLREQVMRRAVAAA